MFQTRGPVIWKMKTSFFLNIRLLRIIVLLITLPTLAFAKDNVARAHFINVGKGDATLLEFPCGAILVDAGGSENSEAVLLKYLDRFFDRRPDLQNTFTAAILTHGHLDHTRNIDAIMQRYAVQTLVTNGHYKKRGHKTLRATLAKHPATKVILADTENIPKGGLLNPQLQAKGCNDNTSANSPDIRLIWGDARPKLKNWSRKAAEDENNHSVSLLVRWGQTKALFTGDLETAGLLSLLDRQFDILRNIDLYQISHHGFRSGTAPGFLEHINPKIGILSRDNGRAWHKKTMQKFNNIIRLKRSPLKIPVWKYGQKGKSNQGVIDTNVYRKDTSGRPRILETASLDAAVFWTGMEGHIVVTMDKDTSMDVEIVN